MKKDYGALNENAPNRKLAITLGAIVLAILVLVEIYLMLNFSTAYVPLALIGVCILILVYRITTMLLKIQEERESKRQKEFESIFKSEKASYLLLRRNFEDLAQMVYLLKDNGKNFPLDKMITIQKSIAKVTINRNKDNLKTVVGSNAELKQKLSEIEGKFAEIQNAINAGLESISELIGRELESKNQDVLARLSEMEKFISGEIENHIDTIAITPNMVTETSDILENTSDEKPIEPVIKTLEEEFVDIPEIEMPEMEMSDEEEVSEEESAGIPEVEISEEESAEIPEMEMLQEEAEESIEAPEMEVSEEETEVMPDIEVLEEEFSDLTSLENFEPRVEPLTDDSDIQGFEDFETKVRELQQLAAEEEPEISSLKVESSDESLSIPIEKITPMEEISHKMTPDEIEQLINENSEEETLPEMDLSSVSEEIPSMEEIDKMLASIPMPGENDKSTEEKPAPSSTDTSHVMTPDEIAALIGEAAVPEPEPEPEPEPALAPSSNDASHVMTPDEIAALLANV